MEKQNHFLNFWQRAWWSKLTIIAVAFFILMAVIGGLSPKGQKSFKEGAEEGKEAASEISPSPQEYPSQTSSSTPIPTTTPTQQVQPPAPKTEVKSSMVSMEQFNRIQEGMTYQEVVLVLGSPGEVISSSDIAGYKTVMYMWKGNSFGANMNATFQNDKMVAKAQFGLK